MNLTNLLRDHLFLELSKELIVTVYINKASRLIDLNTLMCLENILVESIVFTAVSNKFEKPMAANSFQLTVRERNSTDNFYQSPKQN